MTESRKLRRIKAVQQYRRQEDILKRGFVESGDEYADRWFGGTNERCEKLRSMGVLDMLGPLPKLPKLKPGEWCIPFRPRLFVQPIAIKVYTHLEKKYENQNQDENAPEFEAEFFDIIQKWVDDRSCAAAIIGTLELEAECWDKPEVRLLPRRTNDATLKMLQKLEEELFSGVALSPEEFDGIDAFTK